MNEQNGAPAASKPYRRTRKWIRPDLQRKIILMILSVTAFTLLVNFQLSALGLWLLHEHFGESAAAVIQEVTKQLFLQFFLACAVAVPVAIWVGVAFSFRFCGPIYRFKKYFTDLLASRWDPCTLRKGDDLHDVKDAINVFMNDAREKIQLQDGLLRDIRAILADATAQLQDPETARRLIARIDEQAGDTAKKLGCEQNPHPAAPASQAAQQEFLTPAL